MNLKAVMFFFGIFFLISNASSRQAKNYNYSDTNLYAPDTLIEKVNIDDKLFSIEFLRAKYNEASSKNINELSILIKNIELGKNEYRCKFKENEYNIFKVNHTSLTGKGKLFLTLDFNGRGSGFNGKCFEISARNKKIEIYPIYNFDELSLIYFISDSEIIKLEGIWNFKENESHFSNHRYMITQYKYIDTKFTAVKLGNTILKYSSFDEDKSPKQVLTEIKKREPLLLKSLNLK